MSKYVDAEGRVALFTSEFAAHPQPVYAELIDEHPVARSSFLDQPVVSRHEDVVWALRHPEIFSSEMDLQVALGTERPMIPQQIDPPDQTRYRRLLDPHFSRKKMEAMAGDIRAQADALIDDVIDAGACDFNPQFAVPLPCGAFLRLLGLPLEQLDFFLELKDGIIRPQRLETKIDLERAKEIRVETGKRIYAHFEGEIDERLAQPREDLLTRLVRAEIDGEKLTRNEVLDICFLLLLAGLDTVTATLGCNVAYLAANPDQRRRIVSDPSIIPNAVEELLRWETPVTSVPRLIKQDVTVSGVELKKGELCTLLIGAANVDQAHFERAHEVDFDRERNVHAAFGVGPHRCLGSHLARMELRVALEAWHERIPEYALAPDDPPQFTPGIREVTHLPLVWDA
jgi:cytochrome P450